MKKYQIIYADPPWQFTTGFYHRQGYFKPLTDHYQTLSLEKLKDLPINNILDKNAALFLWTVDAKLPDALELLKSWGFKFKTIGFVWLKKSNKDKQIYMMGRWTVKSCEICLFATKGTMTKYLKSRSVRQLVEAPRTEHSKKPEEVRKRIEEMFGKLNRIELFARQKTEGWDVWGDEVESDIDLQPSKEEK